MIVALNYQQMVVSVVVKFISYFQYREASYHLKVEARSLIMFHFKIFSYFQYLEASYHLIKKVKVLILIHIDQILPTLIQVIQ